MLWRLFQTLIAFAVYAANIHWGWMDNGWVVGAWAFMAAYAVTVFPFTVLDWWRTRKVRAEKNAYLRSMGYAVGWRRHLPWNTKRNILIAEQIRANRRVR
jgi:hypothetical protein